MFGTVLSKKIANWTWTGTSNSGPVFYDISLGAVTIWNNLQFHMSCVTCFTLVRRSALVQLCPLESPHRNTRTTSKWLPRRGDCL